MLCPKKCGFTGLRTEVTKHLDEVHNLLLCSSLTCSQIFSGQYRKRNHAEHLHTKHLKRGYRCSVCGVWKRFRNYIYKHGCVNVKAIRDTQEPTPRQRRGQKKAIASQSKKIKLENRPSQTANVDEHNDSSSSSSDFDPKTVEILRRQYFNLRREKLAQCIQDAISAKLNTLDIASVTKMFDPANVVNLARAIYDGLKPKYHFATKCDEEALQWIIHAIQIFNIRSKFSTSDGTQSQKSANGPTFVENNTVATHGSTRKSDKSVSTSDLESPDSDVQLNTMMEMRNETHRHNERLAKAEADALLATRMFNALKRRLVANGVISDFDEGSPLAEHTDSLSIPASIELVEDSSSSDGSSIGEF